MCLYACCVCEQTMVFYLNFHLASAAMPPSGYAYAFSIQVISHLWILPFTYVIHSKIRNGEALFPVIDFINWLLHRFRFGPFGFRNEMENKRRLHKLNKAHRNESTEFLVSIYDLTSQCIAVSELTAVWQFLRSFRRWWSGLISKTGNCMYDLGWEPFYFQL